MAERHLMPQSPLVGQDSRPRSEWLKYLAGIEDIGKRLDEIDNLAGGATLADAIAKINEILAAFRTG
jgi:hypothetical protein